MLSSDVHGGTMSSGRLSALHAAVSHSAGILLDNINQAYASLATIHLSTGRLLNLTLASPE